MALQAQAQLLDELMGKFRNVAPGEKTGSVRFDDDDVCKYYLCGFCPHDLFVNTKADLGPCSKIHDDEMKRQYEKSSRFGKLGFEDDFERFLRSLLLDVEKKIKRGNERLKLTQTIDSNGSNPLQGKQERVAELKEIINTFIKEAESLGEEGKIEEAQQTLEACEKYKTECKFLEMQIDQTHMDQKQMEVCEVCGSFLIVNDAQARVEEHINGKQHMGYAKVKATLEEIRQKKAKEYEEKEKLREKDRERKRDNDRDRNGNRRDRSRDRKRSRSRSRNHHRKTSRNRTRSRSRHDRKRSRSRSRDRRRSKERRDRHSNNNNNNNNDKKNKRSRSKSKNRNNHNKQQIPNETNNIDKNNEIELGEIKSDNENNNI